jgi:hypothetical protein
MHKIGSFNGIIVVVSNLQQHLSECQRRLKKRALLDPQGFDTMIRIIPKRLVANPSS